jgi:hypothetical protein
LPAKTFLDKIKKINFEVKMSHHKSNTIVVRCPDDRYSDGEELEKGLKEVLDCENCPTHYEPNAFGGALEFVLPETQAAWLWRFKIAGTLEPKVERLIALNHTPGCGAVKAVYGPFENDEAEYKKHIEIINQAADFIKKNAPGIEFIAYLQTPEKVEKIIG